MPRIETAALDPSLKEALRGGGDGERVLLEVGGRPIAALVPLADAAARRGLVAAPRDARNRLRDAHRRSVSLRADWAP